MKRSTPLKRTGFKKPTMDRLDTALERSYRGASKESALLRLFDPDRDRMKTLPNWRAPALISATPAQAIEKENALQHEGYMAIVRGMPCAHCRYSAARCQFAHADQGKGTGIKTDCRLGMPLCGPHDGLPGCHYLIGTSGTFKKEQRRALEIEYGTATRLAIIFMDKWPANLPRWSQK